MQHASTRDYKCSGQQVPQFVHMALQFEIAVALAFTEQLQGHLALVQTCD